MEEATPIDQPTLARRWQRAEAERKALIRIARGRGLSQQDAEDCVHEAMLRIVVRADVDDERLGALLTTVVTRIAIDLHRRRLTTGRVVERAAALTSGIDHRDPATEVCDRDEARWTARLVDRLPLAQRRVLVARAEGRSVKQIASDMSTSAKAVESLMSRARAATRTAMTSGMSAAFAFLRRLRLFHAALGTAATGAVVATLMGPGLHLPGGPADGSGAPRGPATIELAAGPGPGAGGTAALAAQPASSSSASKHDRPAPRPTPGTDASGNEWKAVYGVETVVPTPAGDVPATGQVGTQEDGKTREEGLNNCVDYGPTVGWTPETFPQTDDGPICREEPGSPLWR